MHKFETFNDLALPQPLTRALQDMGFEKPTPVQHDSIPPALEGKDILGTAQTGTGKTGAFAIPLLSRLYNDPQKQALILSPTRELAAQIHKVMRQMSQGMKLKSTLVIGGESYYRQAGELDRGVDYIIATPGRLCDHLRDGKINLRDVGFLVLDEVDRMLDMGFQPQVEEIMREVPKERQTFLFSATLPEEIVKLANAFLKSPVRVAIGSTTATIDLVEQKRRETTALKKNDVLVEEVEAREGRIIIFTRTKSRAERLAKLLSKRHDTVVLHGGRSQPQRKRALEDFRRGHARLMVATDLAGRGIDIDDIEHVINFDIPGSREDYIHRVGRTGRLGKKGEALTLLVPGDEDVEEILTGKKPEKRSHHSAARKPYGAKPRPSGGGGGGFRPHSKPRPGGPRRDDDRRFDDRRPARAADGDRPPRRFDDRPRRDERPPGDRPFRPHRDDRPARPHGDRPARPYSDRPPRAAHGDRPAPRHAEPRRDASDGPRPKGRHFEGGWHQPANAPRPQGGPKRHAGGGERRDRDAGGRPRRDSGGGERPSSISGGGRPPRGPKPGGFRNRTSGGRPPRSR